MHVYRLLATACLLPSLAMAQPSGAAADANAKVPAPAYHSAFESFRPMAEDNETPDRKWLEAHVNAGAAENAAPPRHDPAFAAPSKNGQSQPAEKPAQAAEGSSHAH